jgi:hypothetical protein
MTTTANTTLSPNIAETTEGGLIENPDQLSGTLISKTSTSAPPIKFPTASSIAEKSAQPAPTLIKAIAKADPVAAKAAAVNAQQAAQQTAQKLSSAASLIAQSIGTSSEQMHLAQQAALADCRARVRQRPISSLLIAAAFGYAFCLLRRGR